MVGDIAIGAATGGLGFVKHCGTAGARMLKVAQGVIKAADAVHTSRAAAEMVVNGDPSFAITALFKVGGHGVGMMVGKIRGPKCFVAGTQVLAQDETGTAVPVAIETVEAGDLVWSRDEHTGEEGFKVVVETYVRETDELVHLSFTSGAGCQPADGSTANTLIGTAEHPFWSLTRDKWVDMGELNVGEQLSLTSGTATVTAVRVELLSEPVKVYNFQVADWHTYYAAPEADKPFVWVHNASKAYNGDISFDPAKADLPEYRGGKTQGVLHTPDGGSIPLISGKKGPSQAIAGQGHRGFNGNQLMHVEGHAAAHMKVNQIKEAVLDINQVPCKSGSGGGCEGLLSRMLPPGYKLRVRGPNGYDMLHVGDPLGGRK